MTLTLKTGLEFVLKLLPKRPFPLNFFLNFSRQVCLSALMLAGSGAGGTAAEPSLTLDRFCRLSAAAVSQKAQLRDQAATSPQVAQAYQALLQAQARRLPKCVAFAFLHSELSNPKKPSFEPSTAADRLSSVTDGLRSM